MCPAERICCRCWGPPSHHCVYTQTLTHVDCVWVCGQRRQMPALLVLMSQFCQNLGCGLLRQGQSLISVSPDCSVEFLLLVTRCHQAHLSSPLGRKQDVLMFILITQGSLFIPCPVHCHCPAGGVSGMRGRHCVALSSVSVLMDGGNPLASHRNSTCSCAPALLDKDRRKHSSPWGLLSWRERGQGDAKASIIVSGFSRQLRLFTALSAVW